MSTHKGSFSLRSRIERALAGLIFVGATALVMSGTIAVCFQGTPGVA